MTVEISTYHSLISSLYTLHQPNPWKTRVEPELSKPCFELVSARKKMVLVNKTRFLMKQLRHNPRKKTSQTCRNSSRPIKTRKNRSPKPTKSLVCRGHQTLFFVGLECLRSICPQNFWILYIYIDFKYINEILVRNDGWDKYLPQFDIIIIYPTISYINQIPEKRGSSYQNLVLSWFLLKKMVLVNKTFDEAASPQSAKKTAENL